MNVNALTLNSSPPGSPDLLHLDVHAEACAQALGRSFTWQCWGEGLHAVLGPRVITTLLVATGLIALLTFIF